VSVLVDRKAPELTVIESRPPEFSDEALALEFARRYADDLRYVAVWGQWLIWDGARWKRDTTLRAFDLARSVCRDASAKCNSPNLSNAIASAHTVAAVEKLAKADRCLAADVEQWDRDPWLLNTPGGTIDLHTGRLREHRRDDYCTKLTAVAPVDGCLRWLAFLDRVTGGDQEVVHFLRRMAGYALTGITRDHALFFLYGQGCNGKSVFVDALAGVMGDYGVATLIETFIDNKYDRHPTELARLHGARLVTASEGQSGRHWNESRIKMLTGGDRVAARYMQKDFFEFTPQFKLLIVGNYQPRFRLVNEAIRRRLYLLRFEVKIPTSEIDKSLSEKLRAEWPGILAWAIAGGLEWQRDGLAPPSKVSEATAAYFDAEDTFGHWLDTRCVKSRDGWTSTAALYASWARFAKEMGEEPGSQKLFAAAMEARGFAPKRKNVARGFSGVILKG
jgi:putative DNA primase/helicase